jgi:predicted aspartyl protease
MMFRHLGVVAALLWLLPAPSTAAEACHLVRITNVDLAMDEEGGVSVPMSIGGRDFKLLIDTGGVTSMLTETSVKVLGLAPKRTEGIDFMMIGGVRIDHYVVAHDIVFGGLTAASLDFLIMPDTRVSSSIGGTLAPDILRAYDDDFDFANAKFSLFSQDHCKGRVVYWTTGPHAAIPFKIDDVGHIELPVQLDGKDIDVNIDTGSSRSYMSFDAAKDMFGFDEKNSALKVVGGGETGLDYKYPFKTLTFEGVAVNNPDLVLVSKWRLPGVPRLILGMGILRQLHMYIAYKERKLYVTAASAH